jgi:hypothetical protein
MKRQCTKFLFAIYTLSNIYKYINVFFTKNIQKINIIFIAKKRTLIIIIVINTKAIFFL